jgi:hypothetical protein
VPGIDRYDRRAIDAWIDRMMDRAGLVPLAGDEVLQHVEGQAIEDLLRERARRIAGGLGKKAGT